MSACDIAELRGLFRTRHEQDRIRVEVCDTGRGIPADQLVMVFDPFFTTKPFGGDGTGLGLDIAARITDRHRGSLWAESIPGDSRFITSLPPLTVEPPRKVIGRTTYGREVPAR